MTERKRYRITTTGDGAGQWDIEGTFADVVAAVANDMYFQPTPDELIDVYEMLENGLDGGDGWDGKSVLLKFEDGSLAVDSIED